MWDGASGFDNGNDYMFTGRVTALPYYDCSTGGRYMVEVGLSGCAEQCQSDPTVAGGPERHAIAARVWPPANISAR